MKREELIKQVREEYSNIVAHESQQHFHQTSDSLGTDAYYSKLAECVIDEISNGKFDSCKSGIEIINKVAADKSILSEWNN